MKKLALFLALCLMIQAIGLTAFAEEQVVEIPEAAFAEAPSYIRRLNKWPWMPYGWP